MLKERQIGVKVKAAILTAIESALSGEGRQNWRKECGDELEGQRIR